MAISAIDTSAVISGIKLAAAQTGVDFDYLLAEATVESGLDPAAAAPTSSARGLYQFTSGTWLDTVRKHGAEHGLGWAADALKAGADPTTRAAILDLRRDPGASASMAAALASDNGKSLEHRPGRAAGATDLYLAHFLGAGGAARFLKARDADPAASASGAVLPAAAHANAGVFTAKGGRERSLAEVYDRFSAKLGATSSNPIVARAEPQTTGNPVPRTGNFMPVDATRAARTAYLLLAEFGA
ncbi:lytic transglycosylase domain-containing protein [Sphingosinicellaceae bacterium]|nr:lytic transglycosylase domain-containing protein [Sphingosinicellaceae bacterium]